MSRSKGKNKADPIRTLIRGAVLLVLGAAVCAGIFYGLNAFEKHSLDQKIKDTKAINEKREQDYAAAVADYQNATQKGQNLAWPTSQKEGWDIIDVSTFALENTTRETYDRATLLKGGMLLVNPWHKLPEDYYATLETTEGVMAASSRRVGAADMTVKLFRPAIDAIDLMLKDAATAGLKDYFVNEGLRTTQRQQEMFDAAKARLESKYSGDTLIEQTKKSVNEPGTSEYQSGFAFEMGLYPNPNKLRFQDSDQGKWLTENCWKYGIIFRFPTQDFPNANWIDKSYKTGITSSLNIYRWVGIPHATVMKQLDLCLEEYVEYLIQHPHLVVYENGVPRYEIYRSQVGDSATVEIEVPLAATSTLASLDNMGGVITAFTYQ